MRSAPLDLPTGTSSRRAVAHSDAARSDAAHVDAPHSDAPHSQVVTEVPDMRRPAATC